ncbi:MAG: aminoacyl-tRNA hydrolase [Desulfobacterales bacterium]|nr:aminoacyl-tRNA hydrolase [Desulfobacterales bacterium]
MAHARRRLIAGLGNPGGEYEKTRHNAGFMVVDHLAREHAIPLVKNKFDCLFGTGDVEGAPVILVKPLAYMNLSGPPVRRVADYFRILSEDVLVIHDDIDLALGRIQIKEKGGHGGHKGVRSLMNVFSGGDFIRLRVGVGRGAERAGREIDVVDHVLGAFNTEEKTALDRIIIRAGEAVETILCKGAREGMNRFNRK